MGEKISVTDYEHRSDRVPLPFDGFKIAAVSDLHCKEIGKDNEVLIDRIKSLKPDIILCAGDMVTDHSKHMYVAIRLFERLSKEFDIYYSCGNHELKLGINPRTDLIYRRYRRYLRSIGINYLNNKSAYIVRGGKKLRIAGLNIRRIYYNKMCINKAVMPKGYVKSLVGEAEEDEFNILLAHNPEYFNMYADWGADIVISGHIHGGMVVLPYIGGVISPSFRLFPHYDFGEFYEDGATMYLSRGLGSHTIPLRIFNPPEIMCITLRRNNNGNTCKT